MKNTRFIKTKNKETEICRNIERQNLSYTKKVCRQGVSTTYSLYHWKKDVLREREREGDGKKVRTLESESYLVRMRLCERERATKVEK